MATQYAVEVSLEAQAGLDALPGRVAAAVVNFIRTYLQQYPDQAGVELRGHQLKGWFVAQRGQYRVVYKIDDAARTVHVLQILPQR